MALKQARFKSRKATRKEERKAKKQRRQEYYARRGKRKVEKITNDNGKKASPRKVGKPQGDKFKNLRDERDYEIKREKNERKVLDEEIKKKRIERLMKDNVEEEKEIKKLEKQLKFRKGKRSNAFTLDGLDFLLDICDRKITNSEANNTFQESDTEFDDDLATVTGKKKKKVKKTKQENIDTESDVDECDLESEISSEEEVVAASGKKKRKLDKGDESDSDGLELDQVKKKKKEKHVKFSGIEEYEDDSDDDSNEMEDAGSFSDDSFESMESSDEPSERKTKKKNKKDTKQAPVLKKVEGKEKSPKKKKKVAGKEKSKEVSSVNEKCQSDEDISDDVLSEKGDEVEEENVKESGVWEDIYGRTRDREGNVIKAYKPPHLRKVLETGSKNSEKSLRLKRQLKGLLNRLAENNMASISSQIEDLFMSHSRNEMNETLKELFMEAIVTTVQTPERLVAEHAMLIAILHANIGSEVGAYFLQFAVTQFYKIITGGSMTIEDKSPNNLLLFIMQLYNFQIFHSKLMYDLMNELLKNLEEKQIELLLLTLRTVGFSLRKDDPVSLKSVVLKIQQETNSLKNNDENYHPLTMPAAITLANVWKNFKHIRRVWPKDSRMQYMLDVVSAIKNNNVSKIPNFNPEYVEHLKKSMKVLIRKGNYKTELNISLADLLNAEEHGKWWIVGSAWSGSGPVENAPKTSQTKEPNTSAVSFSRKLLDLAKKQRMNTDVRRTIFCTLMSAEDYLDAFERLMKLGLKGAVEREIINVLLHCSLQEKDFNPYYYHLANKFCIFDRKYQIMIQYAVWDKIKDLHNLHPIQITNLAKFLGNVIINKGLPLSVLKVIQFSELDKLGVKFIRQVLLTILLSEEETVATVFARIVHSAKLKIFRDGIRLFLHHFLMKNIKNNPDENSDHLLKMIDVADKVLTSSDLRMIF